MRDWQKLLKSAQELSGGISEDTEDLVCTLMPFVELEINQQIHESIDTFSNTIIDKLILRLEASK